MGLQLGLAQLDFRFHQVITGGLGEEGGRGWGEDGRVVGKGFGQCRLFGFQGRDFNPGLRGLGSKREQFVFQSRQARLGFAQLFLGAVQGLFHGRDIGAGRGQQAGLVAPALELVDAAVGLAGGFAQRGCLALQRFDAFQAVPHGLQGHSILCRRDSFL